MILVSLVCSLVKMANAQHKNTLSGYVLDAENRPLQNISVQIMASEEAVITNSKGYFLFKNLANSSYTLRVSCVGFVTENVNCQLPLTLPLFINLKERIIGMEAVTITAKALTLGSSSVIDKSAIIHTQPTSLADVLQLIPGQLAVNPNLGAAQQINLRQVPSTTDAGRVNALGTQIVLDGVPFSNNANLQTDVTILNSGPSALPAFSTVAGRGNDLRQIPADNIENIEVIRGIPSVKYGDLTSGLIIVNSRIGAFKPEIRIRLNPNLAQVAFFGGFSDKQKINTLNVGIDFLTSKDDVRDNFNAYSRVQGQLAWQKYWNENKKFTTTSILSGYQTIDNLKQNPDDLRYQYKNYANDFNIKFSTEGKWKANKTWLSNLNYIAAITYNSQTSYFQGLVTRDIFPISTATTDTTMRGVYGKSEYLNQTTVDGKPMNTYARVEANVFKNFLSVDHKLTIGTEWRMDVNTGNGRQFDILTPPRQNYSVGDRPRTFNEIPALHQLAYYVEDRISGKLGGKNFIAQAGLRLDNVAPVGLFKSKYETILSPRVNIAVEMAKNIWLRGGYGIAAKAVPLNYLYPGIRYFDLVNFNYFATNPAERLVVITTRSINLNDQNLKPYASKKLEAGFDITNQKYTINVSIFNEKTTNAIGMNREVKPFTYAKLKAESTPQNQIPILSQTPISVDTFFAAYDLPVNNRIIINKGVEFNIDLAEIKAIHTSFNITGAYIQTESFDDGRYTDSFKAYQSNTTPIRVGIYQSTSRILADRFNTSIRFIHRIAAHNIVFSALWQTVWLSNRNNLPLNPNPLAFMNRNGEVIELNDAERKQTQYTDLIRPVNQITTLSLPPLNLFNIRLTKEWNKGFGFSFYANNFLNHRPLYRDQNSTGFIRRNEPIFFGAEFNLSL